MNRASQVLRVMPGIFLGVFASHGIQNSPDSSIVHRAARDGLFCAAGVLAVRLARLDVIAFSIGAALFDDGRRYVISRQ